MARSLIRLPQLDGASIPDGTASAFEFKKEGAGGAPLLVFDTQADEIVVGETANPQSLRVSGDLTVEGDTIYAQTTQLIVEDKKVVAGIPGSQLVTNVGNDEGFVLSSNTLTVTFDQAHGLSANQYVYLSSTNLPEDIYQVASISGTASAEEVFTVTTSGISDFTREDGIFSSSITDSISDAAGFFIPTIAGLVGMRFDDASDNIELSGKDVKITSSTAATSSADGSLQVAGGAGIAGALYVGGLADVTGNLDVDGNATLNGNVTLGNALTDTITFSGTVQGQNFMVLEGSSADDFETTLQVTDPTADRTIIFPDNGGTIAVGVAGSNDEGLALSSSGVLSVDIANMANALTGANAVGGDQIMISDGGAMKSMTLTELQAFLAAGGTSKNTIVLDTQVTLVSGNAVVEYDTANQTDVALGDADFRTALGAASESAREVYLNGVLMREGASNDFQIDDASKEFRFKFQLEINDVITVMVRS